MKFFFGKKPRPKMPPSPRAATHFNTAAQPAVEQERAALIKRFCNAACKGELDVVRDIIAQYPAAPHWRSDLISIGRQPTPVFIITVLNRQYDAARLMLESGGDVDIRDGAEWSALHWAASQGRQEEYLFLLSVKADTSARDHRGRDARTLAREAGQDEMVALIDRPVREKVRSALTHGLPQGQSVRAPKLRLPKQGSKQA